MSFRSDINGLRAIAVAAVVLFHFRFTWASGGFAGVDVFFVISGYLMTKIICSRLANDTFSIWTFYKDRARRIVPALIGLCAFVLIFGYLFVEPITYAQIGKHALAALTFVSNVVFYRESGYFDARSDTKWLLHTWSLSAEWQFYMVYPVILVLIRMVERLRRWQGPILWAGFLLSLATCILATPILPQASFFLLPTRAWEMLAGGLVFLHFEGRQIGAGRARVLELAGLGAIAVAVLTFDGTMPWPSYRALLPVLGACLVIAARRPHALWSSNRPVQTVGRWSYAIYIWHWPIVVGFAYFDLPQNRPAMLALLVGLLAGWAGLSRIASRHRPAVRPSGWTTVRLGGAGFAATGVLAGLVFLGHGLPARVPGETSRFAELEAARNDGDYPRTCGGLDNFGALRPCRLGSGDGPKVLVIGDSHAEMMYARFADEGHRMPRERLEFITANGCSPVPTVGRTTSIRCDVFAEKALAQAETGGYARVVLASIWTPYFVPPIPGTMPSVDRTCFVVGERCLTEAAPEIFEERVDAAFAKLEERLRGIRQRGTEIVLVLPFPRMKDDLTMEISKRIFRGSSIADLHTIDRAGFESRNAAIEARLRTLARRVAAKVVDPVASLCGPETCPALDARGYPLYRDSNHFRATAIRTDRFRFLDGIADL
ncbi:acyltransferase family protein [Methylobacterium sp. M6A4_1b]